MSISFEEFYIQTSPGVYRFVLSKVASKQDAEDLVGDIYYRAFRSVHPGTRLTRPWIYTIASNAVKNYYRDHKTPDILMEELPCLDSVEDAVLNSEKRRAVLSAIRMLTMDEQSLVSLRYFAQLPYKEIARVMGISASAAKTRMCRCLVKLETTLKGRSD